MMEREVQRYRGVTHIALRVQDLREAESFYQRLFGLSVAWREAPVGDTWRTLPEGAGWDDAESAGISLRLIMLYERGFALALEASDGATAGGRLSHLGLQVTAEELDRLRRVAPETGCTVTTHRAAVAIIDDPYGVRWEVTTDAYDDPPGMSAGARTSNWLDLRK